MLFRSKLEALTALGAGWDAAKRASAEELKALTPTELLILLQNLPRPLPEPECAWLEAQLGLTARGNFEILVEWLCIAAASGFAPTFPRIREVLATVGRMKYVRPLYKALGQTEAGRTLAREVFAEASPRYHALTRRVAEGVLAAYSA